MHDFSFDILLSSFPVLLNLCGVGTTLVAGFSALLPDCLTCVCRVNWLSGPWGWSDLLKFWNPECIRPAVVQQPSGVIAFCLLLLTQPLFVREQPQNNPFAQASPPTPQTPSHPRNVSTTLNHFRWGDWISAVLNKNIAPSHVNPIWGSRAGGSKVSVASPNSNSLNSQPSVPLWVLTIPAAGSNCDNSASSHRSVPAWSSSAFPFRNVRPLFQSQLGSVLT